LWAGGVGSIPANSDAQNVPSFRRWRFEMMLSPFYSPPLFQSIHFESGTNAAFVPFQRGSFPALLKRWYCLAYGTSKTILLWMM
jgi:hypothetical protein